MYRCSLGGSFGSRHRLRTCSWAASRRASLSRWSITQGRSTRGWRRTRRPGRPRRSCTLRWESSLLSSCVRTSFASFSFLYVLPVVKSFFVVSFFFSFGIWFVLWSSGGGFYFSLFCFVFVLFFFPLFLNDAMLYLTCFCSFFMFSFAFVSLLWPPFLCFSAPRRVLSHVFLSCHIKLVSVYSRVLPLFPSSRHRVSCLLTVLFCLTWY